SRLEEIWSSWIWRRWASDCRFTKGTLAQPARLGDRYGRRSVSAGGGRRFRRGAAARGASFRSGLRHLGYRREPAPARALQGAQGRSRAVLGKQLHRRVSEG